MNKINGQRTLYLLILLILSRPTHAQPRLDHDLPQSDFILLESRPEVEKARFWASVEKTYIQLNSDISNTWSRGLHFNQNDLILTIPGVGVAQGKRENNTITWHSKLKNTAIHKEGLLVISRLKTGCEMFWKFQVKLADRQHINESGKIRYSCNTGQINQTTATRPKPQNQLTLEDLRPDFTAEDQQTSPLLNHIRFRLQNEHDDLVSCVHRNVNRAATLVDANHYFAPPQGQIVYKLLLQGTNITPSVYRAARDQKMDSCIMDIVKRLQLRSDFGQASEKLKFLVFEMDCDHAPKKSQDRYSCKVDFDVFDGISH
ncbi:MAG: hypothetical protein ACOH5I_09140 [Oligoflexus sp.]